MAKQTINIGTRANDASGDTIRDAFDKVNDNFNEIYTEIGNPTSDLKFTGATISTDQTNQDLTLDPNGTGSVIVTGDLSVSGTITGNIQITNALTVVGDDSTGTTVSTGETFKIAGTQNVTTAVSGDTLTITGPNLSSYATTSYVDSQIGATNTLTIADDSSTTSAINLDNTLQVVGATGISTAVSGSTLTITGPNLSSYATISYVDSQNQSQAITFVGDDSTGTAVNSGETFKVAGTQNITTTVSGDTLTITGPDLTNYLNSTQLSVSGNKITTTESNANIELDPNGTGDVIINSGDVLPLSDNVQSLGSADKRWKDVHIGPGSLIAYTPVGAAITLGYLALSKLYEYAQSTAQQSSLNLLKQIEDTGFTANTASTTKSQQDSGFAIQSDGSTANFTITNSLTNGSVDITPNGTGKVNIDNIEISSTEITTNTADSDLTLTPNGSGSVVADTVTIKNRVISTSDSDADITITPTGTGSVIADTLKIKANEILPTAGNTNLTLSGTGTGKVISSKPHQFNAGYIENINALTSSSTISVDCSLASVHKVTLAENTGFVINNLPTGGTVTLIITQDGGGSNTATFGTDGSTAVKFAGGTPTLSTAGGAIDVVTIFNDGTNYLGNIAKAYA